MKNRRLVLSIVYIILGAILLGCQLAELVDEFWGGMGTAFVFCGVLQLFRAIRYMTNKNYRENVDTQVNDERNKFIAMKAWSWAGYLFVLLAAAAAIIFRIIGMDDMSFASAMCICTVLILYWLSYLVLKRKY